MLPTQNRDLTLDFSNDAVFVTLNRRDSTLMLSGRIARRALGGGG